MSIHLTLQQQMFANGADRGMFELAMAQACEYMDSVGERPVYPPAEALAGLATSTSRCRPNPATPPPCCACCTTTAPRPRWPAPAGATSAWWWAACSRRCWPPGGWRTPGTSAPPCTPHHR